MQFFLSCLIFGEQEHLGADDEAPAGLQDADEEAGAGVDHHQKYMFLLSPTMFGNSQKIFLVVVEFWEHRYTAVRLHVYLVFVK